MPFIYFFLRQFEGCAVGFKICLLFVLIMIQSWENEIVVNCYRSFKPSIGQAEKLEDDGAYGQNALFKALKELVLKSMNSYN